MSKYRPRNVILATTPNESVSKRLALVWGVYPTLIPDYESLDSVITNSVQTLLRRKLLRDGEKVVITAGLPLQKAGTTNMVLVREVGRKVI